MHLNFVSSPFMVVAIGLSSLVALAAIVSTSNSTMNSMLGTQESIQIQTKKNQESLEMVISNDILTMKNNGLNTIVVKEIRTYLENATLLSKISFDEGFELQSLSESSHNPSEFSVDTFSSKTVLGITELGNVVAAVNLDEISSDNITSESSDGSAMINGMGINSRITTYDYSGSLLHGYADSGIRSSLKTYNSLVGPHDFAAQILSTDPRTVIAIPQFNTKYQYHPETSSLESIVTTNPNILGFSQTRTVGGSASATINLDEINISGTGTIILKLNDLGGQTLVLEGTVPTGSSLYLGTDPQYDYFTIPYNPSYGFQIWTGGLPSPTYSQNGCQYAYGVGYNCHSSWTYTKSFSPPLVVSSSSNYYSYYYSSSFPFSIISGNQNPTTYSISSIQMVASASTGWSKQSTCCPTTSPVPAGHTLLVFDREIILNNKIQITGTYQTPIDFQPSKQYYIIAKPNGGTITIKGSLFNPSSTPYLEITNLPPNIPYEIVKDGLHTVSGMANFDGTLSLLLSEVNIGGMSPSGTMYLYPSSLNYRGSFSTVVFDNVNRQTLHIDTPEDKAYVVHAYVQIPVVGNVTVTDVYLDNSLAISYLNGNYTSGNKIRVPIIPGYYDINMKINGIPTTTTIANVLGGTGLKVIQPNTSTITQHNDNNLISSISSTTGTTSYVIATTSGTITTSVTATISGDSEIKNFAYFGAPPDPPLPPPPRDPLKAWVDVYKNGILVNQHQIYFNSNPTSQNSGGTSGLSSFVIDKYTYPQTVINGVLVTNVMPGDFVEYYLYADITAVGSTPPIPPGHIFYHYAGNGHATATIHSGSILSS